MTDMINGGITLLDVEPSQVDFLKRAGYKVIVKTPVEEVKPVEEVPQDPDPFTEEPVKPVKKAVRHGN
jgi:hypothetical protein